MNVLIPAIEVWQQFHWAFFVNTQGLIISLGRFEVALEKNELTAAEKELDAASTLLLASAASMELAGSFTRREYEEEVRPSMLPPHVSLDNFSGLMSWDHATLIAIWRRLQSKFANIPDELRRSHEAFNTAYGRLASSHRQVCKQFGGDEGGSIRHESEIAVDVLDRFTKSRRNLLCPSSRGGCPFPHKHKPR